MAISYDYELYVDGERKFYHLATFTLAIQEDEFVDVGGNANGSYSYEAGAYLGWTDTQGDTVPVFEVGDEFTVHGKMYLYSIPAPSVSLVNTKWKFKDNPDLSSFPAAGTSYNVTFVSNATDYTLLKLATASITYNTTAVYTGTTPLAAPSIALSSDIVTITDNDGNATGFKVYWDGSTTIAETITKTS